MTRRAPRSRRSTGLNCEDRPCYFLVCGACAAPVQRRALKHGQMDDLLTVPDGDLGASTTRLG